MKTPQGLCGVSDTFGLFLYERNKLFEFGEAFKEIEVKLSFSPVRQRYGQNPVLLIIADIGYFRNSERSLLYCTFLDNRIGHPIFVHCDDATFRCQRTCLTNLHQNLKEYEQTESDKDNRCRKWTENTGASNLEPERIYYRDYNQE